MIIVQLMGGLGNQMFQYAFGRALKEKLKKVVKFDLTFFTNQDGNKEIPFRYYDLEKFNVKISKASFSEINKFKSLGKNRLIRRIYKIKRKYISSGRLVQEQKLLCNKEIENAEDNCYFSGYWHSHKYFNNIKPILLSEFSLKENNKLDLNFLNKIRECNSVGIHFRRGDYLAKSVSEILSTCSLNYYYDAIKFINQKISYPYFFIFSDDPDWVKQNIKFINNFEIVSENQGKDSYKDLILMSQCKHNIIANSSFSWWSAWLNNKAERIVIAPHKWYTDPDQKTDDLIPEDWIKL